MKLEMSDIEIKNLITLLREQPEWIQNIDIQFLPIPYPNSKKSVTLHDILINENIDSYLNQILKDPEKTRKLVSETEKELTRLQDKGSLFEYWKQRMPEMIRQMLRSLETREKKILCRQFQLMGGKKETPKETGIELGITRRRVEIIKTNALKKIDLGLLSGIIPMLDEILLTSSGITSLSKLREENSNQYWEDYRTVSFIDLLIETGYLSVYGNGQYLIHSTLTGTEFEKITDLIISHLKSQKKPVSFVGIKRAIEEKISNEFKQALSELETTVGAFINNILKFNSYIEVNFSGNFRLKKSFWKQDKTSNKNKKSPPINNSYKKLPIVPVEFNIHQITKNRKHLFWHFIQTKVLYYRHILPIYSTLNYYIKRYLKERQNKFYFPFELSLILLHKYKYKFKSSDHTKKKSYIKEQQSKQTEETSKDDTHQDNFTARQYLSELLPEDSCFHPDDISDQISEYCSTASLNQELEESQEYFRTNHGEYVHIEEARFSQQNEQSLPLPASDDIDSQNINPLDDISLSPKDKYSKYKKYQKEDTEYALKWQGYYNKKQYNSNYCPDYIISDNIEEIFISEKKPLTTAEIKKFFDEKNITLKKIDSVLRKNNIFIEKYPGVFQYKRETKDFDFTDQKSRNENENKDEDNFLPSFKEIMDEFKT